MGLHIILHEFSDDINDSPVERKDLWDPLRVSGDSDLPHEIEWNTIEWEGIEYHRPKDFDDAKQTSGLMYGISRHNEFCAVLDAMLYNKNLYFTFSY